MSQSRILWVSKHPWDAPDSNDATSFSTIQSAVNAARPGDVILVRGGEYRETVFLNGGVNAALRDLSSEQPLRLISVDGPGAAVIAPPDHPSGDTRKNHAAVEIGSVGDIVIDGFEIRANGGAATDSGGVKFIAGRERTGNPGGVVIENNIFTGSGVDAIKITKTQDIVIRNNLFDGDYSEEYIDFLSTSEIAIYQNDFIGQSRSGIHLKGGTSNVEVVNNYFNFQAPEARGWAVNIGGEVWAFDVRTELPPEMRGFEARNVLVEENVIVNSGRFGVHFQGAVDSVVRRNYIDTSEEAFRLSASRSTPETIQSRGNIAHDNILGPTLGLVSRHANQRDNTNVLQDNARGRMADVDFDYGRPIVGADDDTDDETAVAPPDRPRTSAFAEIAPVTVSEGAAAAFQAVASDAAGSAPSLSVALRRVDGTLVDPSRYAFTDQGGGWGGFAWRTGAGDGGVYVAFVTARDGATLTTTTAVIVVRQTGDSASLRLEGSANADILRGGEAADTLIGLDGDDTLLGGAGADRLDGGAGFDTVDYSDAGAAVGARLDGVANFGAAVGDIYARIEALRGSAFDDALVSGDGGHVLSGGHGDDRLFGFAGRDQLFGEAGDDTLDGGPGADLLDGGAGIDTANYASATAAVAVRLDGGANAGQAAGDILRDIEIVIGSSFDDTLTGSDGGERLDGGAGDDSLVGRGGRDQLRGGDGADALDGGGGADALEGGGGIDNLWGGAGADLFVFAGPGFGVDVIHGFEDGADRLDFRGYAGLSFADLTITGGATATRIDVGTDMIFALGPDFGALDQADMLFAG